MKVKKVVEEWEIWNKEEKAAKSEEEAKKLGPQRSELMFLKRK